MILPYILEYGVAGFLGLLAGLSVAAPADCYSIFSYVQQTPQETLHGFSIVVTLFHLATYALLSWWGYVLTGPFWKDVAAPKIFKIIASFFIGFTCLLGPLRLLSLVLPYQHIYLPSMAFVLVTGLTMMFAHKREIPKPRAPYSKMAIVLAVVFLLTLLLSTLILQVDQGDFHFSGHGYYQYAYLLDEWKANPPLHFPVTTKHYDELLFNYFLTVLLPASFPTLLSFWLTVGLVKASVFAFLFLLFRKMGMSAVFSFVSSLFFFIGTTSLLPTKYYLIFDSSNFLYFTVHSGRIVEIPLILWVIVEGVLEHKVKHWPKLFIILLGLGLAATTLSNGFWFIVIYSAVMIYRKCFDGVLMQPLMKRLFDPSGVGVCYASIITCMLFYGLSFIDPFAFKLRTMALGVVVLLALLRFILPFCLKTQRSVSETQKNEYKQSLNVGVILVSAIIFGYVFLGNMYADNPVEKLFLKAIAPITGVVEFKDLPGRKGDPILKEEGTWAIGDYRELAGNYNEYCRGLIQFVDYYGVILLMILMVNYMYTKAFFTLRNFAVEEYILYEIFLMAVASLPCFLFFTDFVLFGSRAWLKTRFLEIPVYIIMFTFLYFVHKTGSVKQKAIVALLLIVYSVVPFMATQRPRQIMYNYGSFIVPFLQHKAPPVIVPPDVAYFKPPG